MNDGGAAIGINGTVSTPMGLAGTFGISYLTSFNKDSADFTGWEFIFGGLALPNISGWTISAGRTDTNTIYRFKLWG